MSQITATRIDSHAHVVPPALINEARKSGASLGVSVVPKVSLSRYVGKVSDTH